MSLASWLEFKSTNKIFGKVFFEVLHSFLCRHQKDQLPDGLPAKVMADQEPWFLFKTSNRNRKKQESEERTPAGICNLPFPSQHMPHSYGWICTHNNILLPCHSSHLHPRPMPCPEVIFASNTIVVILQMKAKFWHWSFSFPIKEKKDWWSGL